LTDGALAAPFFPPGFARHMEMRRERLNRGKEETMRKPYCWRERRTWGAFLLAALTCGCGTTRVSDTTRTATEQLLISRSIDDTVSNLDFRLLAGKRVFLDPQYLDGVTDKGYLISSLRQHLLACGCLLQEERKNATYVVEPRAGSVGTDRNDLLVGIPQTTIPSLMPGMPGGVIPEIPLAKKTNRRAVAKIAVFAYNRVSGERISQSGTLESVCDQRDSWLFGAGPFRRGTLIEGTEVYEQNIKVPILDKKKPESTGAVVNVKTPTEFIKNRLPPDPPLDDEKVKTASRTKKGSADDSKVKTASTTKESADEDSKVIQASAEEKAK
jgi:hypothetical protein